MQIATNGGGEGEARMEDCRAGEGGVVGKRPELGERRGGNGTEFESPKWVELPEVEPWGEPVNGGELLDDLLSELRRFVVFPKWGAEAFALWVLHTYAFRLREVTTYMGIESPEKECGKSTLLTVLSQMVERPAVSSNISPSAFFRVIEELQPTLLIDEADTNLRGRDELRGILNSGYTKATAFVWRICYDAGREGSRAEEEALSSTARVARYSCWCPKAIAAIGHLHPTLASRCVVVRMQRKRAGEKCERLKRLEATELKQKCAGFAAEHAVEIAAAAPAIPRELANRAADVWEPLLALADLAGGRWPEVAREAAMGLTARAQEQSPIGSLLIDVFMAFMVGGGDRRFSRELVERLKFGVDRPWMELQNGKPVTESWLAQHLRPYGILPRPIRIGEQVAKGYMKDDLMDAFSRYVPRAELEALKAEVVERSGNRAEGGGVKAPEGKTGAAATGGEASTEGEGAEKI